MRMVADNGDRFDRVAIGNTGLPYNPDVSESIIAKVKAFRASPLKLNLFSMQKQISKMKGIGKDGEQLLFSRCHWALPAIVGSPNQRLRFRRMQRSAPSDFLRQR